MKTSKVLIASASLIALTASMAAADNNEAWLDQDGSANSALIQQTGSDAKAGENVAQRRVTQDGDNNTLTILQTGAGRVGTGSNFSLNNLGVDQIGNRNNLAVTQNFGSAVFEVQQNSTGATGPVGSTVNTATISQTGNMRVSRVRQTYTGDGSVGTANSLSVVQTGSQFQQSGIGDFNGFNPTFAKQGAWQTGEANTATVTQTGAGQVLWLLDQNGATNSFVLTQGGGNGNRFQTAEQFGNDNTASFTFTGTSNGAGLLTGAAAAAGAANRSLLQDGNNNQANMVVTGSNNQFGFRQVGDDNVATGITLLGSGNELGVNQEGNRNELLLGTVTGDSNNLGVDQFGDDNSATVSITGSFNGGALLFSGNALTAAGSLSSGMIQQSGNSNIATLAVLGDSNAFTLASIGDSNTIIGNVNGSNNQVAVVQTGNMNTANFAQIGNGNNAGIVQ